LFDDQHQILGDNHNNRDSED